MSSGHLGLDSETLCRTKRDNFQTNQITNQKNKTKPKSTQRHRTERTCPCLGWAELPEASRARAEGKQNGQAALQRLRGRQAQPAQSKVLKNKSCSSMPGFQNKLFFAGGTGNRTQCYVNPKQEFSTKAHPQPEPLRVVTAQMENSSRTRLLLGGVSSRNA